MADTNIRLYAGVPLTRDNLNFLNNFTDDTGKLAVFEPYKVKDYGDALAPVRRSFESIVVDSPIDEVDNVNYMTFRNGDSHRYYCYVTNVVYESEGGSRVYFEIDYMTTWYNQLVFSKQSMIEREHVGDDSLWLHKVDENLNVGELQIKDVEQYDFDDLITIVGISETVAGAGVVGEVYGGTFSGLQYKWYDTTLGGGVDALNLLLGSYVSAGKADAVVVMFMLPKTFVSTGGNPDGDLSSGNLPSKTVSIDFNTTDLDGYIPKNKKLFTFPFNFLYVTNNVNAENIYKYEYSNAITNDMRFGITCDVAATPTCYLRPLGYKTPTAEYNVDELLTLSDFPMCQWTSNAFANWLGQNKGRLATTALSSLGNPVSAVSGGLTTIGQFSDLSVKPSQVRGRRSGTASIAAGIQTFTFLRKTITAETAQRIDNYFTKFGYKVDVLSTINVKKRTSFDYIKTTDCNVQGSIPAMDLQEIRNIFNNGVTFWHTTDVGNYSVNNDPV